MALQFPTENYASQDPTLQLISSPLNAFLGGQQTARVQAYQDKALRDAEEAIRERQLLNIGRQRDAYKAQLEMTTPDFMEQKLRGESGTSATQELSGAKARGLLPFVLAASNPNASPEELDAAKQGATRFGTMLAESNPENIAKIEQLQLKQKIQQVKPADVQKLMNWAASTGTPLSTAIDIYLQGNQYLSDKSGVPTTTTPQVGQPTQQPAAPTAGPSVQLNATGLSDDQQKQIAQRLSANLDIINNPNMPEVTRKAAQADLAKLQAEFPIQGVQSAVETAPQNLLGRVIERKTNSSRESRYSDNVAIAANEARTAVQNISSMPFKTTSGIFGATREEKNIFSAPVNALKNKLSNESTTSYNAEVDNIGSFYARLINGGLSPSQSEINKFTNQFRIREGEDGLTALTRLAQMRQAFERAAEIKLASKATPPEQLDMWRNAVADVREAIPITVAEVNKFRDLKNPKKSFNEFMRETKQTVDNSTQTVTIGGKTYNRPASMSDVQWSNYKKAMGVQ